MQTILFGMTMTAFVSAIFAVMLFGPWSACSSLAHEIEQREFPPSVREAS